MPLQIFGSAATAIELNLALLGSGPIGAEFNAQLGALGVNNANAIAYANGFINRFAADLSDAQLAERVVGHLVGNGAAGAAALRSDLALALAANPGDRGVVVLQFARALTQLEGDVVYGAAALHFNRTILDAYLYASDPIGPIFPPPNPPNVGKTYVLTAGADHQIGTDQDDTFFGTEATLKAGDVLDGGKGNDSLKVASSGTQGVNITGFSAISVETVQLTSDAVDLAHPGAGFGSRMSLAGVPDLVSLVNDNSSTSVQFDDLPTLAALKLQNVSGGDTRINYQASVVAGATDVVSLTLVNNQTIAGGTIGYLQADGVETFNIHTQGGRTVLSALVSDTLASLSIDGDQAVRIGSVSFHGTSQPHMVDAGTFTNRLDLGLANDGDTGMAVLVQGGAGNDRIAFSSFDANDRFDGGAGTDTLALPNAAATAAAGGRLHSVELLEITTPLAGTLDLARFTGVLGMVADAGLGSGTTIAHAASGFAATLHMGGNAPGQDLRLLLSDDGLHDQVTLTLDQIGSVARLGQLQTPGLESLTLNAQAQPTYTSTGRLLTPHGTLHIASLQDSAATELRLGGDIGLALGHVSLSPQGASIHGGTALDSLRLDGALADYALTLRPAGPVTQATLHDTRVALVPVGDLRLDAMDRLVFADQGLALDLGPQQSGGMAVMAMAATAGPAFVRDSHWATSYLAYFDGGASLLDGAKLLLDSGLLALLAGGQDSAHIVPYVLGNLFGPAQDATVQAVLTAPLQTNAVTLAQWLASMMASDVAQAHVQLAGYAQTGLAFAV